MTRKAHREDVCACGRQMTLDHHEYPLYENRPPYGDPYARYLCPVCDEDAMQDEDDRRAEMRRG